MFDTSHLVSLRSVAAWSRGATTGCPGPNLESAMSTHERIALDPAILAGKPIVRGTRLSVEFLIGLMAEGWSEADILANYPGLSGEDLKACLAYARDVLASERVHPSAA